MELVSVITQKIELDYIRTSALNKIKVNMQEIGEETNSNLFILFELVEEILASAINSNSLLYELDKIKTADEYLYNHSINTAILSVLIGISLGFKSDELLSLARGAFFSDIGKLQIDPLILTKRTDLTEEDIKEIRKYPRYGYEFMKNYEEMDEIALDCILHSREKIDGSGYPDKLKGDEISIYSQVVGLATFFDAMSSDRGYKKAISPYGAMTEATNEVGLSFSADILKKSIKILGYYDVGMYVELKTRDLAKVVKRGRHKPVLNMFQGFSPRSSINVYEIDMAKNPSVQIKDVLLKTEYDKLVDYA